MKQCAAQPAHSTQTPDRETEPGNLLLLGLGLWTVILALVMILGSAISIHNARNDLFAQADALAIDLAATISDRDYYHGSSRPATYSSADVVRGAQTRVGDLADEAGAGVAVTHPTGVVGETVTVTLEQVVALPLIPSFLTGFDEVRISATSHARLREMDGGGGPAGPP